MNDTKHSPPTYSPHVDDPVAVSRRGFLQQLCLGLAGVCTAILAVPVVGFVLAPLFGKSPKSWVNVGKIADFAVGKTVNVTITDPSSLPWAGISARARRWLRRESETEFIAFSVNCTHLGLSGALDRGRRTLYVSLSRRSLSTRMAGSRRARRSTRCRATTCAFVDGQVQIEAAPIPIQTALS